jgi:hypothetical protein
MTLWFATFLFGFVYASWKMEWVLRSDLEMESKGENLTQDVVESNRGLLSSSQGTLSSLGNFSALFPQLDESREPEIVIYSLFGAYFTIVYGDADEVLAVIDNGLDG